MKTKFLALSLILGVAFANAQTITCPGPILRFPLTSTTSCAQVLSIPNPTIGTDVIALLWKLTGATTANSPLSGKNFVGSRLFNVGATVVTYVAFNALGQQKTCSFYVILSESVLPTIKCPKDTVLYSPITSCFKTANLPNPTTGYRCTPPLVYWTLTGATKDTSLKNGVYYLGARNYNIGLTTATYTVSNGVTAKSCTFKIIVKDTLKPVVKCPASLLGYNKADSCQRSILSPKPTVSDACGFSSITWKMTGATYDSSFVRGTNYVDKKAYNPGMTKVTYSVKDKSANLSTCSYVVNVLDTVKPTIFKCPDTIKTKVTTGCSASVTIPALSFKDNCGTPTLSWSLTGATTASGNGQLGTRSFNIGATYVADTLKDASGNIAICRFRVVVYDTIKPSIQCNVSRIDTITTGCSKNITLPNPIFSDNCTKGLKLSWKLAGATTGASPLVGVNFIGTQNFKTGTTICTYTLKDTGANAVFCTFTVKVVELTKPVLTCGAAQTEISTACTKSILVNAPTFSDNCGITTLTWKLTGATILSSPTTGTNIVGTKTFNKGLTTVTYVAKDGAGNVSSCSSRVTLIVPVTCRGIAAKQSNEIVTEETADNLNVNLLSNPTHHSFILNTSSFKDEIVEVSVYTVNGKKIDQFKAMPNQIQKFGEKYSKGSYLIEIRQGTLRKTVTGIKL